MKWIAIAGLAGLLAAGCATNRGGSNDTFDNEGRYKSWGYPPADQSERTMPNDTGANQEGMGGSTSTPGGRDWGTGGMVDDLGQ